MTQFEIVKQLEYLIAFQTNCLRDGNWDEFDRTENQIKDLEEEIIMNCVSAE